MITARRLSPCLLYTPPVAPTDLDGLASCPDCDARAPREAPRACLSGGRRSRNKAAVGEPAAGSFAPGTARTRWQPSLDQSDQPAAVDHWARASTKNVERSEIGGGEPQPYANRHFSNAGGNPACGAAATPRDGGPPGRAEPGDTPALRRARRRAELKHISKPRRRKQTRFPE